MALSPAAAVSAWRDPERWAALREPAGCPICREGPFDVVADLEASWVTMDERSPMRGYACLVFKRHAIELHDLTEAEGSAFMRDARRLSRAVSIATGAVKLNYEVHGNTLPHLHLHVFPRYAGDPFEGKPIDPRSVTTAVYAPGELAVVQARVRKELGAPAHRGVELRPPASDEEWLTYHAMRRHLLFERRGRGGEYDAAHPDEHRAGHHPLILWRDGEAVGVIRVDVAGPVAVLRRVAIREDLQRRGFGRSLIASAEEFARANGCRRVESHADADAVVFYERCGYERVRSSSGDEGSVLVAKSLE